jgi:hypothetical protein
MSVKFQLPAETDPEKDLSPSSIKEYTRRLNHLAQNGFATTEDIKKKIFAVVNVIKALAPGDDEKDRNSRRAYISAINWVMPELKTKKWNPLYNLYNKSLPHIDNSTGRVWLVRKDYKPPAE